MDDDRFYIENWNLPKRPRVAGLVLKAGWYIYRWGPEGIPYAHLHVQATHPNNQMQLARRACDGQKYACENIGPGKPGLSVRCPQCVEVFNK